ncbi:MAG: hypothetical protein AABW80_01865 [Nanoarchaeota archaeon]
MNRLNGRRVVGISPLPGDVFLVSRKNGNGAVVQTYHIASKDNRGTSPDSVKGRLIRVLSESEGIALTIDELARRTSSLPVSVKGDLAALKRDYEGSESYEMEVSQNRKGRTYCLKQRR